MWYIILTLLTTIYILINLIIPGNIDSFIGTYILRPALFILLAILVYLSAKKEGLNIWRFKKIRRWQLGNTPFEGALLIAGFQISLLIIAGLYIGFGESPYSHTPLFIIINIIFIGSMLIGVELSRAYLIKKSVSTRKNITLLIGFVTLLFMLISIPTNNFLKLNPSDPAATVKFIGETIIPLLAAGLLASYLAYLGGALPAIAYMGTLQAFQWFSPILPNLDWTLTALIGTLAPAIGFLLIQNNIQNVYGRTKRKIKKIRDPAISWAPIAIIAVLLIFFSFGYLGVQPTIIYSGSMRNSIDVGDMVIVSKTPTDEIQKGDIIQYKTQDMKLPVVHRVQDIYKEQGNLYFITKGDANQNPDLDPVLSNNINGKVIFNIPKIGWIPIVFKEMFNKIGINI
jgi:signal peptidase